VCGCRRGPRPPFPATGQACCHSHPSRRTSRWPAAADIDTRNSPRSLVYAAWPPPSRRTSAELMPTPEEESTITPRTRAWDSAPADAPKRSTTLPASAAAYALEPHVPRGCRAVFFVMAVRLGRLPARADRDARSRCPCSLGHRPAADGMLARRISPDCSCTIRRGRVRALSGSDSELSGSDSELSGSDSELSGSDSELSGSDSGRSSDHFAPTGDDFAPTGDDFAPTGDDFALAGDDFEPPLHHFDRTGNLRARSL